MISHVMGENQACHRFFEVMEFGFWNPTSTLPPPAVTKSHDVTPKAILLLKIINQQTFETPPRNSKKGGTARTGKLLHYCNASRPSYSKPDDSDIFNNLYQVRRTLVFKYVSVRFNIEVNC